MAATTLSLKVTSSWALTPVEKLGKKLYFDTNLSEPDGQACASCHLPSAGFADPDQDIPVSEGVIPGLFGGRNSPTASYAMYSPNFHFDENLGLWIGGQFWDGRATGDITGDPLADQALGPFLNPVEMANTSKVTVVRDALYSEYQEKFEAICGHPSLLSVDEVDTAYQCIATAIGEFERSEKFARFDSKYDEYLQECIDKEESTDMDLKKCANGMGKDAKHAAKEKLSKDEWAGLKLFVGNNNNDGIFQPGEGAGCAVCHSVNWTTASDHTLNVQVPSWAPENKIPPVFTDFSYDNLGIPKSRHPILASNPIDLGLGSQVFDATEDGKFKVSTLRNIADTAPYGHNGFFTTLERITHFYNVRDENIHHVAEVPGTMNITELGSLGLTKEQEQQIVAFMKTLSDDYED